MIVLAYVGGLYANTHLFIVCMLLFYNKNSDFAVFKNGQNHLQSLPCGNRAVIDINCHLKERGKLCSSVGEKSNEKNGGGKGKGNKKS